MVAKVGGAHAMMAGDNWAKQQLAGVALKEIEVVESSCF